MTWFSNGILPPLCVKYSTQFPWDLLHPGRGISDTVRGNQARRCRCKATRSPAVPPKGNAAHLKHRGRVKGNDMKKLYLFFWSNSRKAWLQVPYAREEGLKCGSEGCDYFCKWVRHEQCQKLSKLGSKVCSLALLLQLKRKPNKSPNIRSFAHTAQNDKRNYFIASSIGGDVLQQPKCNKPWTVNSCEVK